jgi:prevent-host-death family protein
MPKIIPITQAQKDMAKLAKSVHQDFVIVTTHGKGKMVLLPYFEEGHDLLEDYMEDYEIHQNKGALQKRWKASSESGFSDFKV